MKKVKKIKNFSVFFNNEEEFNVILGNTSYYKTMQDKICNLVSSYQPNYVLELGSGSGKTAFRIAKENQQLSLVAVDNRSELILQCQNNKEFKSAHNLTFANADLTKLDTLNFSNVDLVYMLYSFNYINDPVEVKEEFLKNIYNKMKSGATLIIGDWFLNDTNTFNETNIKALYKLRVAEGAQSVFWSSLDSGKSEQEIENAHAMLAEYKKHHKKLLSNIITRNGIFPISKLWLTETATKIGFKVELDSYINNINDAVVVLKK